MDKHRPIQLRLVKMPIHSADWSKSARIVGLHTLTQQGTILRHRGRNSASIMPTLLDTLASYIPALIVQRHTATATPLVAPSRDPLRAAGLFADISGFTALTEQLARRGPSGVEELTRVLNVSFGQ